MIISGQR